ncbi:NfeD family protein [Bacillus sp. SCS-151]|uniref:NfeD family protein n=1 Tax=Nanhaiella sioensis TaxID=3115293 RepID=UPI00397975E9
MRRIRLQFFVMMLFTAVILSFIPMKGSTSGELVYVIPLEDTVEKGLYAFIDRSISEAEEAGADLIILEINTPGGAVAAAGEIGKRISSTDVPIVAYINIHALSAGAYIALNADEIYMRPTASMGAAAVITSDGNAADEKAQSSWNTSMEGAAALNGRDPIYAIAMADKEVDLPEYNAEKGKLLTLTADQAYEVKYAEGIVNNRSELTQLLGFDNPEIVETKVSLAENIARFITNPVVVPILLSIGSIGLLVELYSPGFGVPGLMGASSLLLFFYGHFVAGLAGMEAIIFFFAGVVLIILEFFVPGGILGMIGFGSILTSLFLATDDVGHMAVSLLIAIFVTILASILLFKVFGKKIRIFNRIILRDSTNSEEGYITNKNRNDLIGKEGYTTTALRPSGTVVIDNERLDVVTEGGYIDNNKKIKVIKTEGARIVVREIV